VRQPFISLRLCAFAAWPAALRGAILFLILHALFFSCARCLSAAADFSSRKGAKPQRDFSLRLFAFVRQPFISLRLCAFAR
jgi:hypothetical protein